jgi:ATP-dependent Lon protease
VKDPDTIQIMKDFMANGRFSRGVEVIADASLSFVGNIDLSIQQLVNSDRYDLFQPLPAEFDLAIMDRFACLPPRLGDAEEQQRIPDQQLRLHHRLPGRSLPLPVQAHTNRYEEVTKRMRLGRAIEGRDEKGIKKTVAPSSRFCTRPMPRLATGSSRSTWPMRRNAGAG